MRRRVWRSLRAAVHVIAGRPSALFALDHRRRAGNS
jgi:hypothetical protein